MTQSGYTDIPAMIRVWDGMKLCASRQTNGAAKGLLRDVQTNALVTHAEIFLPSKTTSMLKYLTPKDRVVLGLGAFAVVVATAATVKGFDRLIRRRAAKTRKSGSDLLTGVKLHEQSEDVDTGNETDTLVVRSEIDVSEPQLVFTMSAADWQRLLQKAAILSSLEERIWMLLSSVRIEGGDEDVLAWQRRISELSPREAADELRELLETHPELSDDEELADLIRMFIDERRDDGDPHPKHLDGD